MTKRTSIRTVQAAVSYAVIVGALHFILGGWIKPLAWGALGLLGFAYIFNSIREVLINKVILQTYNDHMESLVRQISAVVSCSYCSKENKVPFRMDERNEFSCQHCGKPNLLMISATTAQITAPLAGVASSNERAKA